MRQHSQSQRAQQARRGRRNEVKAIGGGQHAAYY
jgi:hypothetical protein